MNSLSATTPNQITFLADTASHRNRFDIPSSDGTKSYRVSQAQNTGEWQCSCPAWIYCKGGRKPCKHLLAMSSLLLKIEGRTTAVPAVQIAQAAKSRKVAQRGELAELLESVDSVPAAAVSVPTKAPAPQVAHAQTAVEQDEAKVARKVVEALAAKAEAEVAALRAQLQAAEARAKAFRAAAEAA